MKFKELCQILRENEYVEITVDGETLREDKLKYFSDIPEYAEMTVKSVAAASAEEAVLEVELEDKGQREKWTIKDRVWTEFLQREGVVPIGHLCNLEAISPYWREFLIAVGVLEKVEHWSENGIEATDYVYEGDRMCIDPVVYMAYMLGKTGQKGRPWT